jgi:hypothetical protein
VAVRRRHLAGFDAAWPGLQDGRDRRDASRVGWQAGVSRRHRPPRRSGWLDRGLVRDGCVPGGGQSARVPAQVLGLGRFLQFHRNRGVPVGMGIDTTNAPHRNTIWFSSHPFAGRKRKALAPAALSTAAGTPGGSNSSGALAPTGSSSGGWMSGCAPTGAGRRLQPVRCRTSSSAFTRPPCSTMRSSTRRCGRGVRLSGRRPGRRAPGSAPKPSSSQTAERASCPDAELPPGDAAARLRLRAARGNRGRARETRHPLAVHLGSGSFRLRAGERRRVPVRLTSRGLAFLRSRHQLGARALVVSRDASAHRTTAARHIVLSAPRRAR